MRFWITCLLALSLCACGSEETPTLAPTAEATAEAAPTEAAHDEPALEVAAGPAPTEVLADGARLYGTAISDTPTLALADISAAPETYDGQIVHTAGTIARVCQAMGCWMELQADGVEPVRVPMAGHAFFLPRDVAGRPAEIEGRVALRTLSPEARAHLEGEGALATASTLSIDATGVVVR